MANNSEIGNDFLDIYLAKNGFRKVPINSPDYSVERERLLIEVKMLKEDREETKKDFDIQLKICEEEIPHRDGVILKANQDLWLAQGEVVKLKRQIVVVIKDSRDIQISEQRTQIDTQKKEILRLQRSFETERETTSQQLAQLEQTTTNQRTKLQIRTAWISRLQGNLIDNQNLFLSFLLSIKESLKFPEDMNLNMLTTSGLQDISNHIQNQIHSWNQNQNELDRLQKFKKTVAMAIRQTTTFKDGNEPTLKNMQSSTEIPKETDIKPRFNCNRIGCKAKCKFLSDLKRHMKQVHNIKNPLSRWKTGCKFCGERFRHYSALWHHRKVECNSRRQETRTNSSPGSSRKSTQHPTLSQEGKTEQFECLPVNSRASKKTIKKVPCKDLSP